MAARSADGLRTLTGGARLAPLASATLRANPLVRFAPAESLRRLGWKGEVRPGAATRFVGALHAPDAPWLGVRAIDRLAHRLHAQLRAPALLSPSLRRLLGRDAARAIARLVLDGILEIESPSGFVHGADALSIVFARSLRAPVNDWENARLSSAALAYGAQLAVHDVRDLADRLYGYNRIPADGAWRRTFASPALVEQYLGLLPGAAARTQLERHWRAAASSDRDRHWSFWHSATRAGTARASRRPAIYKLFVSPLPEQAPATLRTVIDVLAAHGAPPFKFGTGTYGLLRPDKIVAYFPDRRAALACGASLLAALASVPAHGVPFSAGLAPSGIVSWGLDPDAAPLPLADRGGESWRTWLTARLARALLIARHAHGATDAVSFARHRLWLDGIDVERWTPAPR